MIRKATAEEGRRLLYHRPSLSIFRWWEEGTRKLSQRAATTPPGATTKDPLLQSVNHPTNDIRKNIYLPVGKLTRKIERHYQQKKNPSSSSATSSREGVLLVDIVGARQWIQQLLEYVSEIDRQEVTFGRHYSRNNGNKTTTTTKSTHYRHQLSQQHLALWRNAKQFVSSLESSVEQGHINPNGKYGKELSKQLELALFVYRHIRLPSSQHDTVSPLVDDYEKVLHLLRLWNLDIRNKHFEYAIEIACKSHEWTKARDLIQRQIDPGAGQSPATNISPSNPLSLYAIARWAQQEEDENVDVVQEVFTAVQDLVMVSPTDERKFILAAGVALGQVGEWEKAISYLETQRSTIARLDHPLVASVMRACLLSGRPDKALEVYNSFTTGNELAKEWQWGGEQDRVDPLTRDLAMRAMAAATEDTTNDLDTKALSLLMEARNEGVPVSPEALLGVVEACEQQGNVDGAVSVVLSIFQQNNKRFASFEDDSNASVTKDAGADLSIWLHGAGGDVFTAVMRTCNAQSKFGVGLFCLRLLEWELFHRDHLNGNKDIEMGSWNWLCRSGGTPALISSAAVALCGLQCYDEATKILCSDADHLSSRQDSSRDLYRFAVNARQAQGSSLNENPWLSADRQIHRLLATVCVMSDSDELPTVDDMYTLEQLLASTMKSCSRSRQADLALLISAWYWRKLNLSPEATTTLVSVQNHIEGTVLAKPSALFSNDALLAETISALRWQKHLSQATSLFEALLVSQSGRLNHFVMSMEAGLMAFVADGRGNEAVGIAQTLDGSELSERANSRILRLLTIRKDWQGTIDYYGSAVNNGVFSEASSLVVMNATISSKADNRLRVLRALLNSNAANSGLYPEEWTEKNFWDLKQSIGDTYARLFMGWNDEESFDLERLGLAFRELHHRQTRGLVPRQESLHAILDEAEAAGMLLDNDTRNWPQIPTSEDEWRDARRIVMGEICTTTGLDQELFRRCIQGDSNIPLHTTQVENMKQMLSSDTPLKRRTIVHCLKAIQGDNKAPRPPENGESSNSLEQDLVMLRTSNKSQ